MYAMKDRLFARRKELGLTMERVGRAAGVTKATVMKWEKGITASIKPEILEVVADVLETSPAWLMGMTDNPAPEGKPEEHKELHDTVNVRGDIRDLVTVSMELDASEVEFLTAMARKMKGES